MSIGAVEVPAGGVREDVRFAGYEANGYQAVMVGLEMAEDLKEKEMERVSSRIFDHPGATR